MTRTILVSLSLCLCVGLGADIHAQEAPPVDQLMQDGSQAYQHGDFEQRSSAGQKRRRPTRSPPRARSRSTR